MNIKNIKAVILLIIILTVAVLITAVFNREKHTENSVDTNEILLDSSSLGNEDMDIDDANYSNYSIADKAGSGSAVMEETNEEDVYVDPVEETQHQKTQEGETTEKEEVESQQQGISAEINTDGADPNYKDLFNPNPDLPDEEDAEWFDNLIDQNGTVLH